MLKALAHRRDWAVQVRRSFTKLDLQICGTNKILSVTSPIRDDIGIYRDSGATSTNRHRMSFTSTMSEEKENGELSYPRSKLSPELRHSGSGPSSGRGSPARGFRNTATPSYDNMESNGPIARERPISSLPQPTGGGGVESWRRAAEVTSQLKARIEQMKVSERRRALHLRVLL